jgi:hypothetical protein
MLFHQNLTMFEIPSKTGLTTESRNQVNPADNVVLMKLTTALKIPLTVVHAPRTILDTVFQTGRITLFTNQVKAAESMVRTNDTTSLNVDDTPAHQLLIPVPIALNASTVRVQNAINSGMMIF